MDIFDQITEEAKKACDFISKKAGVVKDYTVATWTAADIRNRIKELYLQIGQAVFNAHTTGEETAEQINDWIAEIEALTAELKEKEAEKQAIKNKRVCAGCGRSFGKQFAFCPHCGAKAE